MGSTNTHLWVQVAKVVPIIGDSFARCKQNILDKQAVPKVSTLALLLPEAHTAAPQHRWELAGCPLSCLTPQ
jgi:hypothetical protein